MKQSISKRGIVLTIGDMYRNNTGTIFKLDDIIDEKLSWENLKTGKCTTRSLNETITAILYKLFKKIPKNEILKYDIYSLYSWVSSDFIKNEKCNHQWTDLPLFTSIIIYCPKCNKTKES